LDIPSHNSDLLTIFFISVGSMLQQVLGLNIALREMSASQQVRLSVPVWFMTVNGHEKPVWSLSLCQKQQGWHGGQMGFGCHMASHWN